MTNKIEMTPKQIELAHQITALCREYRQIMKQAGHRVGFIYIENEETGEFLAYTSGEARGFMKNALEGI